jgi:hypothetical protein
MSDNQVSDILAQAFAAEGVDTLFTLMGDANMYWSASMADNHKVRPASRSMSAPTPGEPKPSSNSLQPTKT